MPRAEIRIAEEFADALSEIYSERILARIERSVLSLSAFPEMGSSNVRPCLSKRYGMGLRQIAVSTFLIVYRYEGRFVDVLALVYGPSVA